MKAEVKKGLVIHNSSLLLTIPPVPGSGPGGSDLLGTIPGGALAVTKGMVIDVGPSSEILAAHPEAETVDAGGRLVMPGFVDSHTHLLYGGERVSEMEMRLGGASYLDIFKSGGGIHSTVKATRETPEDRLISSAARRLSRLANHGTTTVEIKSGYGLDSETEEKMLRCIARTGACSPLEIVSTYLGAHTLPPNTERKDVMSNLLGPSLSRFARLAEFFDVFCEDGAFTLEESRKLLTAAKKEGFKLKIHAGQFTPLGAAGMAASLGAVSADHLETLAEGEIRMMAENSTVAVLLPGVPFFLQGKRYADGRALADAGVTVALASDYNPGSCPSFSMPFMISLGVFNCGLTADEAVRAATFGGAAALNREHRIGSLCPGMEADILILDLEKTAEIPYYFGTNPVYRIFKGGKEIGHK